MGTEQIKLKNGAFEPKVLVDAIMNALHTLEQVNPVAFYELVMKCRDPAHQFTTMTREALKEMGILSEPNDGVHGSVRNTVLSAVSGDEFEMRLESPV